MDTLRIIFLTFSLLATVSNAGDHNITEILSAYPEYSVFNSYLSQTKLNDEIDSRATVTLLVLNNSVVTEFAANQSLSVVKIALSIHILLDFFDSRKLQSIGGGTMITTTLYQTTGTATGSNGFVNITDLKGGKVGFGSAANGSKIDSLYTKSVDIIPYNISVLEIDSPIVAPGVLKKEAPSVVNISRVLEVAGCRTFAKLITETGVVKTYDTVAVHGITVFAPPDPAFKAKGALNLNKLTNAELVSLLRYHAVSGYNPIVSLKMVKNKLKTLATNPDKKFELTVRTEEDSVRLFSGTGWSRVESTVLDSAPVSILKIQDFLVPVDLLAKSPACAPAPAPEASTPSEPATAPPPGPVGVSPNAPKHSPPAPSSSSPIDGSAPADNPTADGGNSNGGDGMVVPVFFLTLVTVSISGIIWHSV